MILTFIMAAMNNCKKYIKTWQMEPIGIAQAAALTPNDVEIKFFDDRVEEINYEWNYEMLISAESLLNRVWRIFDDIFFQML